MMGETVGDPTIIAAAAVTVIAALVSGIVTVINAVAASGDRKDARVSRALLTTATQETGRKTDGLVEKTAEIHALTNSNLSKVTASLQVALERIDGLQQLIGSLTAAKKVSDTVAEKAAEVLAAQAAAKVASDRRGGGVQELKKIEENTAETAENTKKIDREVTELNGKH